MLAAVLGLIPGVGAMYNGQFIKGLIHVVIFAVLVSAAHVYGIFGLFIAGWVCYQVFEAYHTAKARRDGDPLPDPLGLNELSEPVWRGRTHEPGSAISAACSRGAPASRAQEPGTGPSSRIRRSIRRRIERAVPGAISSSVSGSAYGPPADMFADPGYSSGPAGSTGSAVHWRRKEPIGAIILIALGLLFLLGHFDWFSGRMFEFSWPVLLIGLGVWLMVRRLQDTQRIRRRILRRPGSLREGKNESLYYDSPLARAGDSCCWLE